MKLIWLFQCADDVMSNKVSMVTPACSYTYADICKAVAKTIYMLGTLGVKRGQQVVLIPEHDESAVVFMAAASAIGIQIVMPYNLQNAAIEEWVNIIQTVSPDKVVYLRRDAAVEELRRATGENTRIIELDIFAGNNVENDAEIIDIVVENPDPVENFLVLFTSGTTGKAKAVSISESLVCKRVASVSSQLKFSPDARIFMSGLMNNTTGIIFSFGALLHDATLVFPSNRVIEDWPRQVVLHQITHMMLRPVALRRFVAGIGEYGAELSCLRVIAYGAAALSKELLEEARVRIPCEWTQGYGLSETFGPFCWLNEEDHRRKLYEEYIYCVGKPDDTLDVSLHFTHDDKNNVGEVVLRGTGLMEGYYDIASGKVKPVDEYFHTGDYGHFTNNGELILKGRISNTLLSENGHRIYPEEVENIIADIIGIHEVLLVSLPADNNLGNVAVICIYGPLTQKSDDEISQAILAQLSSRLSEEKWPDYVYPSRTPFPRNSNDKIIKGVVLKGINADALIKLSIMEVI
ncbi:acyl-CoA synthetase [Mixta theicola]|uniref:Acyl-CoA synthetase n=1 Tax=Mixta theicola TaxID=1458355 RepID=A0A2K1Q7T5_9GAMM|nr:long-chain fatty acid--CoA ligase [Mixta theicola]PNS11091.1 acyl-CoA synthetase [Mixta theicola]GLR08438.1 long-chain-fatty-acid--CoA ligase FadD13 [Mixta theicola]